MKRDKRVSLQIAADAHAAVRRASEAFGMKQSAMIAAMARGWEMLDPDAQAKALRPGSIAVNDKRLAEAVVEAIRNYQHGARA